MEFDRDSVVDRIAWYQENSEGGTHSTGAADQQTEDVPVAADRGWLRLTLLHQTLAYEGGQQPREIGSGLHAGRHPAIRSSLGRLSAAVPAWPGANRMDLDAAPLALATCQGEL